MGIGSTLGRRFEASLLQQVVSVISGAALTVILARALNSNLYGLLFLSLSVLSIGKLFSTFGFASAASRYISEYKENDPSQIPYIIKFSLLLTIISMSAVSIFVTSFRGFLSTSIIGNPELEPFLLLGGTFIIASTIHSYSVHVLQGFELIIPASVLSALNKGSRLIFAVGLVLLGFDALGALTGYVLAFTLSGTLGIVYIFKKCYKNFPDAPEQPGLKRRIAEYSVPTAVSNSAHSLDHRIDSVLVGFFVGPVAVAYYTIGKQVVQFIEMPMSALGFTLSPTYGSQKAKGNADKAARIYETALSYGLLLYIPAAAGVVILADPMVELTFGPDYTGAVPVLQILSVYAVLVSVTKLTGRGLDYLGRARARSVAKMFTAILNVGLNIILIPVYGAVGAAVATVVTFAIYTTVNMYIMHLELDLRVRWLGTRVAYSILFASIMSAIIIPLSNFAHNLFWLLTVSLIGFLIWFTLVSLTGVVEIRRVMNSL